MYRLIIIPLICIQSILIAQDTLTFNEFIYAIKNYHPVVKQANLIPELANQGLLKSRGAFDPVLAASFDQKNFDGKNYWTILESKLQIPTYYGISVEGGYQFVTGDYTDPSRTLPSIGLPQAGITATLGKGLYMDERRAFLKQAKLFKNVSKYEQIKELNEIYTSSVRAYINWSFAFEQQKTYINAVGLARERHIGLKNAFFLGERPAVDTLESYILLQTREASLQQADLEYTEAKLRLSTFLWMIDETPAELKENVSPVLLKNMSITYEWNNDSLSASARQLYDIHPDIKILEYKNNVLDIDKKLKISKLLPQLDVKYNFLYNPNQAIFFSDNYKWGVDFKIPIPMREARGDLGITKLKIKETEYAIALKKMELSAKLNTNFIKYNNYQSQRNLYREMYRNYQTLFQAEVSRFDLGESSVFLVNSREIKLIEAELKWYEMIAKSTNAFYELIQSTGKLIF